LAVNRLVCVYEQLARQGILVRAFENPPSLKFGLPGNDVEWERLDAALARVTDPSG